MVVDIILRRVERTAVLVCVLMSFVAFVVPGGGGMTALAVLGGGLLVSISYRMILSTAGVRVETPTRAAVESMPGDVSGDVTVTRASPRRTPLLAGVNVAGRYALLTVLAYVMIARLRLPPVGLLAGASSIVAAVSLEAVRFLWKKTP